MVASDLDGFLIDNNAMAEDDERRFREVRDKDSLIVPFQCDTCHFLNIHGRLPSRSDPTDNLLLTCIRRVSIDSMWSRERSTVRSNLYKGLGYLKFQKRLGLEHRALPPQGPYPMRDDWGVASACAMALRSCNEGKNAKSIQFDTTRKF